MLFHQARPTGEEGVAIRSVFSPLSGEGETHTAVCYTSLPAEVILQIRDTLKQSQELYYHSLGYELESLQIEIPERRQVAGPQTDSQFALLLSDKTRRAADRRRSARLGIDGHQARSLDIDLEELERRGQANGSLPPVFTNSTFVTLL